MKFLNCIEYEGVMPIEEEMKEIGENAQNSAFILLQRFSMKVKA